MLDPYQTLGVSKSASADEIKSAYRKLAKKLHPDVNPGKKDIEQKFKDVTAAYDLLSDKDKRARYDRGEIDAQGNERGFAGAGADPFGGGGTWRSYTHSGNGDPFEQFGGADDIFAQFMSGARGGRRASPNIRGPDVTYSLAIPFVEASLGGKRRVTLSSGKEIDVTIPPGTLEGNKLRLRGQGMAGLGGPAGDAIIEMHVEPHPFFTRKDNDIHLEVPISLPEAVLGATIKVPTLDGHVTVKVPKGANTDTVLRLKGKGVPLSKTTYGDMFVKLKLVLPEPMPADLAEWIETWAKKKPYDPRKKLGWT
jgi:DnaJ-class molecular chaperone